MLTIWTLKEDGSGFKVHRVLPIDITDAEEYSDGVFLTLRHVLDCLDPEWWLEEDSVQTMTDLLRDTVLQFRKKQIDRRETLRKLREQAAKRKAAKQP